jgi:hypothetical protein
MKAETVTIDEQEGRLATTQAGLNVTGVPVFCWGPSRREPFRRRGPRYLLFALKRDFSFIAPSLEAKFLALAGE